MPSHLEPFPPPAEFEAHLRAAIRRTRRRYRSIYLWNWNYASWKVALDPCYRAVAAYIPEHSLTVDLGSGMGLLATVLAELGGNRRTLGVEYDAPKHRAGLRATRNLEGVSLVLGDIRTVPIPPCHTVTFLDVLHYFPVEEQQALLRRAAEALAPGGRVLIRETDAAQQGGTRLTRTYERLAMALGWNRGTQAHFRSRAEWTQDMERAGFRVAVEEAANRMNPGNVLLVGERI